MIIYAQVKTSPIIFLHSIRVRFPLRGYSVVQYLDILFAFSQVHFISANVIYQLHSEVFVSCFFYNLHIACLNFQHSTTTFFGNGFGKHSLNNTHHQRILSFRMHDSCCLTFPVPGGPNSNTPDMKFRFKMPFWNKSGLTSGNVMSVWSVSIVTRGARMSLKVHCTLASLCTALSVRCDPSLSRNTYMDRRYD